MKKSYTKPEIIFESFSLSTSIAAGCSVLNDLPEEGNCGYPIFPGMNIFDSSVLGEDGCNNFDYATNDSLCYYVPTDGKEIFNS